MERIDIRITQEDKESWVSEAHKRGLTLTELVHTAMGEFVHTDSNVHTKEDKNVHTKGAVHTDVLTMGDREAEEMVVRAREIGERDNWARVREQLGEFGYEYDSVTRELSKGGRVIKLIY
jgi:hypothetical protein